MNRTEFQELRDYYLSMPDCMVAGTDKSPKRKMSMFYEKVRWINQREKFETPEGTDRRFGFTK